MPKGKPTDLNVKLAALSELEDGERPEVVAQRHGVSVASLFGWKAKWDVGESLENQPSGAAAKKAAAAAPPAAPAPAEEEAPVTTPSKTTKRGGEFVTSAGTVLPAAPAQGDHNKARRSFPDDFKYVVAKALLSREAPVADVSAHYDIHPTVLRNWSEAVREKRLKGPKAARTVTARVAPSPAAEIVLHTPPPAPAEPAPVHPAHLLSEVTYLRRENARLKRQLEQALNMVLDANDGPSHE